MHPEDRFAVRALKAGASGYLTKETAADELVKAIKKVHGKGKYISSSLAEKLALNLQSKSDKPVHELLSDREFQVLRLIASGKTMSEIADHLNLAVTTISTYRARILDKLNLSSNAELIYYAISNNLLD
jgi:DNA-binding NarL/FixJ family response regulator